MTENKRSKHIAKNTAMLYIRMLLIMAVTLYTSRVVLKVLGVEDFGIYNVVGGVVAMFSFLNTSMSNGIQRFLSFELGTNNRERLKIVFGTSLTIQLILSILIVIFSETIGLWFLNTQMTIPSEKLVSANWAYHFSVLTFVAVIFQSSYNAVIIAHEKMNVYAYVSILDVFLKLICVYVLEVLGCEKLILYAFLMFLISLFDGLFYFLYCKRYFPETHSGFIRNKELLCDMLGFSGWNTFGSLAHLMKEQGVNLLLNIFFGPIINAARGIAYQILAALNNFILNFQLAVRPQMIKSYAQHDFDFLMKLLYSTSKLSYFLMLFLSLPVFVEIKRILNIWLGSNVPEYTFLFARLAILTGLVEVFASPITTIVHATGRMKKFQMICSSIILLITPISFLFFKLGYPPESAMIISLVICTLVQGIRLFLLKQLIDFSIRNYVLEVVSPVFKVSILSLILPAVLIFSVNESLIRFGLMFIVSLLSTAFIVFFVGLNISEKALVTKQFKLVINKIKNNKND